MGGGAGGGAGGGGGGGGGGGFATQASRHRQTVSDYLYLHRSALSLSPPLCTACETERARAPSSRTLSCSVRARSVLFSEGARLSTSLNLT